MTPRRVPRAFFAALIVLCVVGAWAGAWSRLEGPLHDQAVRLGLLSPAARPHPIIIVAIDDNAIRVIEEEGLGTWPWSRSIHAEIVEALDLLGARTIAFDISFGDLRDRAGDEALLEAVRAHGGVIFASRFARPDAGTPDPAAPMAIARRVLEEQAVDWETDALGRRDGPDPGSVEERALLALVTQQIDPSGRDVRASVRAAIAIDRVRLMTAMRASAIVASVEPSPMWPQLDGDPVVPTPGVARYAAGLGNTDMGSRSDDGDGVVRRVPLWIADEGRAHPLLGLAGALHYQRYDSGGPPDRVTLRTTSVDGVLEPISTSVERLAGFDGRPIGGVMRIRWPRGERGWREQFDGPSGDVRLISVLELRNVARLHAAVLTNIETIHAGTSAVHGAIGGPFDPERATRELEAWRTGSIDGEAFGRWYEGQTQGWRAMLEHARSILASLRAVDYETLSPEQRDQLFYAEAMLGVDEAIAITSEEVERLRAAIEPLRAVEDGLVFIGSVATKRAIDLLPTSIHPETPGVFVHATVAHNVLTQGALAPAPVWLAPVLAGAFGVVGIVIGARTSQWVGVLLVVGLCVVWFFFATSTLDARVGLGSVIAPPIGSLLGVWLARATYRTLIEQRERRRTEQRFKAYVAPEVVDILVSNPELSSMEPVRRELTVMFSDIAGFTTMSERLGTARTTEALGAYLRDMTSVLQETGATLDKYLGDGIMAFWGAPIEQPDHADRAVRAARRMLERLDGLNAREVFGEVGPARVRIGIATGVVSVGDFGNPPIRSAYTVIGDTVNLSARLESANKQLGTTVLINARCAELLREDGGRRPVGRVVVVGKSEPERLHEVLLDPEADRERTEAWITLSGEAEDAFVSGAWDRARTLFARLRDTYGDEKIATLHLEAIDRLERTEGGVAAIELTEK